MAFADSTANLHSFNDTQDIPAVHDAIKRLTHPGGGTNMAVTFGDVRNMFSLARGGRTHVPRVVVLASDGDFQSEFAKHSSFAKTTRKSAERRIFTFLQNSHTSMHGVREIIPWRCCPKSDYKTLRSKKIWLLACEDCARYIACYIRYILR